MDLLCDVFGHKWKGCRCRICGKQLPVGHDFSTGECPVCHEKVSLNALRQIVRSGCGDTGSMYVLDPVRLRSALEWAYAFLPKEEAQQILFDAIGRLFVWRAAPRDAKAENAMLAPYIDPGFIVRYFSGDGWKKELGRHAPALRELLGRENIRIAADMLNDPQKKQSLLQSLCVPEQGTPTDCEAGRHDWEEIGSRTESTVISGEESKYVSTRLRCRICGEEKTMTDGYDWRHI